MSVNVYFTDEVKKLDGFTKKPYKDSSGDEMKIDGMHLFSDKARLYAMLGDENSVVPEKLQPCVESFTLYESIPQVAHRETGIYCYESAEAEVEWEDGYGKNGKPKYKVHIVGKKIEDMRDLLRKIKTGTIRPEESYEGQQLGMSRSELEAQWKRVNENNTSLADQLELSYKTLQAERVNFTNACEKNVKLRRLASELREANWPWCTKTTIADNIDQVLDANS
jgi:hypothetical protein